MKTGNREKEKLHLGDDDDDTCQTKNIEYCLKYIKHIIIFFAIHHSLSLSLSLSLSFIIFLIS